MTVSSEGKDPTGDEDYAQKRRETTRNDALEDEDCSLAGRNYLLPPENPRLLDDFDIIDTAAGDDKIGVCVRYMIPRTLSEAKTPYRR